MSQLTSIFILWRIMQEGLLSKKDKVFLGKGKCNFLLTFQAIDSYVIAITNVTNRLLGNYLPTVQYQKYVY